MSGPYTTGDLSRVPRGRRPSDSSRPKSPRRLSLRAGRADAGVIPAAAYHHFKDRPSFLGAVAARVVGGRPGPK